MERQQATVAGQHGLTWQFHRTGGPPAAGQADAPLPWKPGTDAPAQVMLKIAEGDGLVWAQFDQETGGLARCEGPAPGGLALKPHRHQLAAVLAVVCDRSDLLINGLPGLKSFSILRVKDSLVIGSPGYSYAVTATFKSYVGPPTAEMLGKRCPVCKVPITAAEEGGPEPRVITCRCGAVLHWESEESHPGTKEEVRLECYQRVRGVCPCCQHELSSEETLLWNPTK